MKGIPPTTIPLDGMVVLNVDLREMVSNVVTAYCAGNRRSVWRAEILPSDILFLLDQASKRPELWLPHEEKFSLDPKSRYSAVPTQVQRIITGLFQRPRATKNYGRQLESDLTAGKEGLNMFDEEFVAMPALGYARRRLVLKADTGMADKFAGTVEFTHVPSICSPWNLSIAFMCMMSDLTRWSEALLPVGASSEVGGHPYKDQPFGALMAFDKQLKMLWSLAALYLAQGSLIVAHANRRLMERATQIRMGVDLRSKPALLAREENIATVYNRRLHPLSSVIARALGTGTIKTYHGEKDLLYCHGAIRANKQAELDLGEAIVADALAEFGKEHSDAWGTCAEGDKTPISMGKFARQMLSLGEYGQAWDDIASKLGWTDITMNIGAITQETADFILCDGTTYSHEPAAGLLGLIPVLSLGNIKVGGYNRRHESSFGITADGKTNITYSAMVVDGYQSATGSAESYERLYIPAGMSMGEGGTEPFLADAIAADPLVAEVINHYASKNESYVNQFYGQATGTPPGLVNTDWDAFSVETSAITANSKLSLGYVGQVVGPLATRYLYKDRFYHRFPVKRAREDDVRFFTPTGLYEKTLRQDGNVLFTPIEATPHSSAELEKLVNAISVAPPGTTAQLPLAADQVKEG